MSTETARPSHPLPAVGVVVVDRGRLLLVQRSREPFRDCWAVPGGKVRWGETLAEAAVREAKEETGLVVEVGEVLWVGEAVQPPGPDPISHNVLIDFAATVVGGTLNAGSDAADAAFVALREVRDLLLTPTMHDLLDVIDPRPVRQVGFAGLDTGR